ncbi:MAG: MFS transporter [Bacteroidales bacterium]|nr:MFS transporter [Bacteroidales bacterium]
MKLFLVNKVKKEYDFFLSMPRDMRVLLITNIIYALVIPVIDIFVGAYIMRSSDEPGLVAIYQLAAYTGIPITFMINGFLLNRIKISHLYSFGMLLSGVSMVFMMTLGEINAIGVGFSGLIMGSSFGFFWANRDFLALNTTNDDNRNYYYGLETFFYTITFIIVPVLIGWFLVSSGKWEWIGNIGNAYKIVTLVVFILTIISSIIIHQEKFQNPKQKRFIYFKFDKLWNKMLLLSALKGLAQGYLVTAPAILIMRLVGDESSLGAIQSLSGVLSAIVLYFLGRLSKPKHRIYIFSAGLIIFFIGTLVNGVLFSASGVIVFVVCKVMFMPLHDIAYFPIQMKVIDVLSFKENRNQFAYIFNHEFGLYIGRFFGLVLFIVLIYYVSESFALKYSLIIIATVQLLAIPVAKRLIRKSNTYSTKPDDLPKTEKQIV